MSINPNDFAYMTPAMLDTLRTLGITQVEQIAAYTAPELDKLPIRGVGLKVAQRWIDKARQLIAAKLANSTVQSLQMAAQVAPVVQSTDLLGVKMPTQLLTCNNLCTELASKLKLAVVCNTVQLSCNNTVITSVALPAPKIPVKITTVAGTVLPGPYYMDAAGVVTDANCNVVTPAATDVVTCVCSDGGTTPTPTGPVLKVTKTVSPNPAVVGVPATYSVTVQNIGSSSAVNVVVNDVVPSVTTYLAGSIAGGDSRSDATPATGNGLQWNITSLAAGASQSMTYQAIPQSATQYSNTAVAQASNAAAEFSTLVDTPVVQNCAFNQFTSNTTTGTLNGVPFQITYNTCTGTPLATGAAATQVLNLSAAASFQNNAAYTPDVPVGTLGVFQQVVPGSGTNCFKIHFNQPVTDVTLHIAGLDPVGPAFTLEKTLSPGATGITKLSGAAGDLTVTGDAFKATNPNGTQGANGSMQINGTYTDLVFSMTRSTNQSDSYWMFLSDCA